MVHIHIPNLPPSANHAYESVMRSVGKKGKKKRAMVRRLSDAGTKYHNEVKEHILKRYPHELPYFIENHPYVLIVRFTFQGWVSLCNKSWLDENPKKRAKSRYKKLDVSNRAKLFEDAFAAAVGLDDSHNFFVGVDKTWARDYEATDVWAINRELERDNPIDAALTQLRVAVQAQPY